jgi:glycosyltransferase involved in cell wall biosynthesis
MILNYYNDLVFQPSEMFLNKDFGQVATVLGSLHTREVTHLICCNEPNEALRTFAGNGVVQAKKRFRFLPSRLDFLKNMAVYRFLFRHRGAFSVLVMFPFWPSSDLQVAKLFRALNPGAKIIMKLDANLAHIERLQASYEVAPRSRFRQHHYYRLLLDIADVVIYETHGVGHVLTQTPFLGLQAPAKFVNVFNGLSDRQVRAILGGAPATARREQVIVISGRLSSPEKNVELIFRSDPVPEGWRIRFIGGMDNAFRELIENYRRRDPNFERKYEFAGEITDKRTYFRALSSARIMLLCSDKEGFPMVYAEAHYFGLYIVTTDVSGAAEATDGGRMGKVIPRNDPAALRDALRAVCADVFLDAATKTAQVYGARHFIWEDSLRTPAIDEIFALDVSAAAR